ncbi:MAG: hypothetical protein ACQETR_16080 [Thermodesulfobacteriota bacterium]
MNEKSAVIAMNYFSPIPEMKTNNCIAESLNVERPAKRPVKKNG